MRSASAQQVMGLVDRKPVRPGGLDPEPGERRHQLRQKPRPLGDLDPQQVDHDVLFGITEKLETFTQPRWRLASPNTTTPASSV